MAKEFRNSVTKSVIDRTLTENRDKFRFHIYHSFKQNSLSPKDVINPNSTWFLKDFYHKQAQQPQQETPTQQGQHANFDDATPLLYEFLLDKELKETGKRSVTVEMLTNQIIDNIMEWHNNITENEFEIMTNTSEISKLKHALHQFDSGQSQILNKNNTIELTHTQKTSFFSEILNYYKIKYKCSTQSFQSNSMSIIYPEGHLKEKCSLQLNSEIKNLYFTVVGKQIQRQNTSMNDTFSSNPNDEGGKHYKLLKVFTSIRATEFMEEAMKPTYLILSYVDQTPNAPFQKESDIEIGFLIHLDQGERIKVINKLLKYYDNMNKFLQNENLEKEKFIKYLLNPFKGDLEYKNAKISMIKKDNTSCYNSCSIF